jgi:DNA-binding transcriptional ArsR family regulator
MLASGFRALGDPTRLTIALALRDERAENLVSHHLRSLRRPG